MQKIITSKSEFNKPILFLIFNRPDTTARVFDVIKKAKPMNLYVAADGPRKSKDEGKQCCEETHKIIKQVDFAGFGPENRYTWVTSVFLSRKVKLKPLKNQPEICIGGGKPNVKD